MKFSARGFSQVFVLLLVIVGLYSLSTWDYLLFHVLAESAAILIAFFIFLIAWNTRQFLENQYLLFLGLIYPFVGILDFLHTLAYKGMGVFPGVTGANIATQLWIQARYVESLSFLIAPLFLFRKVRVGLVLSAYALTAAILVLSIYPLGIFPDCFIEGSGLTLFKIVSEYAICLILVGGLALVTWNRDHFHPRMLIYITISITATIASELTFTTYLGVYDMANMTGHLLKVLSFYFIFRGIIETGLREPYGTMFRNLKKHEEELIRAKEEVLQINRQHEKTNRDLEEQSQKLERMNTDLENIFSNVGVGTVLLDRDLKVTRSNKLAGLVFDFTRGDAGRELSAVTTHFPLPGLVEDVLEVIRSSEPKDREVGGPSRQFKMRIIPYTAPNGTVDGTLITLLEVTELNKNERALREQNQELLMIRDQLNRSEKHFQDLFHRAPVCFVVVDGNGIVTDINTTCENVLDLQTSSLVGRGFEELIEEDEREEFRRTLQAVREKNESETLTLTLKGAGGKPLRFITELVADRDSEESLRSIRLALLDVTELDSLKKESQRLGTLWETVFSSSKEGFAITTLEEGTFLEVNDGYLALTGYSSEEIIGRTVYDLGILVKPKIRRDLLKTLRKDESAMVEAPLKRKDGQIVTCLVIARRISLGDQEVILSILRDISETKKLKRSLEETCQTLEQRNVDLENFIHTAAHDLRAPLISTIGFFVLLKKGLKKSDPNTQALIERISDQLYRYDKLLRDLLDFARTGVEKPGRDHRVSVGSVVQSILEDRNVLEGEKAHKVHIQEDMPSILMNETRVHQIFENLLSNSFRFRKKDQPLEIEVGVENRSSDREIPPGFGIFFVRDNGIGIHPRDHSAIFSLFSRTEEGKKEEGTGVGLSIVKRILETEGGWIEVESEPGKGATFFLCLPIDEG